MRTLTVKKNRENEYNMAQTRKAINHQKQEWAKRGIDYDEVKGMTQKELEEYRIRLALDSLFDKEPLLLLPPNKLKKSIN